MRWIAGQCAIVLAGVVLAQGQATTGSFDQQPAAADQPQTAPPQAVTQDPPSEPQNGTASVASNQSHKWHVKLGTVSVGAGYIYAPNAFIGPFYPYGAFWPYGFFEPNWYFPAYFYGPYAPFYGSYFPGFAYANDKGKVELAVMPKSADVYLDGAYAGPAGSLKKIWLSPGAYDLTVSTPGGIPFRQRIYVLSGKSLKIQQNLLPQNAHEEQ